MSSAAHAHAHPHIHPEPPLVPSQARELSLSKIYVWEAPVRATHWLIVLSVAILSVTGIYIGHPFLAAPGPARQQFVMGTVRTIHLYAAIVFGLSVFSRIAWMFLGNRFSHWDKFIPVRPWRYKGIWPTLKFYLFMLRKPPGFVGHNPLAGLTYTFVFLLYLSIITTGFTLYSAYAPAGSPFRHLAFLIPVLGGLQQARFLHHLGMWLLLGFAVHHVYSAVLMSQVEQKATMESIFSGYKFVSREDVIYSGYRFLEHAPKAGALLETDEEVLDEMKGEILDETRDGESRDARG